MLLVDDRNCTRPPWHVETAAAAAKVNTQHNVESLGKVDQLKRKTKIIVLVVVVASVLIILRFISLYFSAI